MRSASGAVVGAAKEARGVRALLRRRQPRDAPDGGGLDGFLERELGQGGGQPSGQHRLGSAGRTDHQDNRSNSSPPRRDGARSVGVSCERSSSLELGLPRAEKPLNADLLLGRDRRLGLGSEQSEHQKGMDDAICHAPPETAGWQDAMADGIADVPPSLIDEEDSEVVNHVLA
jgi:hypothetical protein